MIFTDDTLWEFVDDAYYVWEAIPSPPEGIDVMVYLIWDANPSSENVDTYEVDFDNGAIVDTVTVPEYDLSALPDDNYTVRIRAHNTWGWSDYSSPFDFTKNVPSVPVGIALDVR